MKKITSIVLVLFMLINGCVMAFATDTAKTEDKNLTDDKYLNESIEILQALGLQTDTDLTKVDLQARVTRAQWAESAVELLNVNLSAKADDTVYFEEAKLVLICKKLYQSELQESGFLYQDTIDANYPQRDFHTMYVGKIEKVLVRDDEYLK